MRKSSIKLAAVPVALALVVGACGSDGSESSSDSGDETDGTEAAADDSEEATDDTEAAEDEEAAAEDEGEAEEAPADTEAPLEIERSGDEIIVTGPERDESEAGAIQDVLGAWGAENGVDVTYLGDAAWETNINTQLAGGNPPDVSIFPQPGKLADFARAGDVLPLGDEAAAATAENWDESWTVFGNVDGEQYGVPVKADLKSLVWYQPSAFEEAGYT
ncbi:extracellular solute-binding protein, partial [Ilumatobacter sp.]|uniref:extracellular solute-binding protein n=1 Tax=Ilumatobacter sp. TaxID=1967498 RepID=UPI003C4C316E